MRLLWIVCFAVIGLTSSEEVYEVMPLDPINFNTQVGAKHAVTIASHFLGVPVDCYLVSLDGTVEHINEDFDHPGLESFTESDVDCGLIIVVSKDMAGTWMLFARSSLSNPPTERRLPFTIIIEDGNKEEDGNEPESMEESSEEEENIIWLPQINRVTRTGQYIDITLNKIEHHEDCYFITPAGEDSTEGIEVYGVTAHNSSNYVSCRISIGPMEASLLGTWTLCGKGKIDEGHERCQQVSIAWNDNSNPSRTWQTNNQSLFEHTVNLGGSLNPVVIGHGTILTCHIITPNGEDLVLGSHMEYPHIRRRPALSDTCEVTIGPIEKWMLGDWTLYAQFRSSMWFNEVRLPMKMILYDEENPYDQPYNVTNLEPFNRVINLDTIATVEVTGTGSVDSCHYRAPSGQVYDFHASDQYPGVTIVDAGKTIVCRMSIGPLDETMLGQWQIVGKFSRNGIFTERRQMFNIIQEDPDNPIIEDRVIHNLTERVFDTKIGANHTIIISRSTFITPQSCHIRTPAGRQYTIMDGFNLPGVTVFTGVEVVCGVTIEVFSEDMIGEWVLISRAIMSSDAIERRQPFVIYVEEKVEAIPQEVVITEGNDLYMRLRDRTDQYETCKLIGPEEDSISVHDIDEIHNDSCGFVVKAIEMRDKGTWEIVYGTRIIYRARIKVSVIARDVPEISNMTLILDGGVYEEIGPYDAVYCKLIDPRGIVVFDGFGRCRLSIDRVTMELSGYWRMLVGVTGRVLTVAQEIWVTVVEAEAKATVSTRVQRDQPSVRLSCSVSSEYDVRACKFRDPSGNILLANEGVGEDRYVFHGSEVRMQSEVRSHECGLRIINPTENELGLWRCGIETETDTHYGFLSVVCPWLMEDPEVLASVITDPVLTADRSYISAVEGDGVTMSCSVQSTIRYCYFRNSNGTIFSIKPSTWSPSMQYIGNGFDAGECGVRFTSLVASDSGQWSCHVGLLNQTEEQRARFQVNVQEPMTVRQYMHQGYGLVVEARVHSQRHLEYCRFVRIDGRGFSTDSVPEGYHFLGALDYGHCFLQIEENSMLNLHPWTVAVKIRGQELELSRQTTENLLWVQRRSASLLYFWIIISFMGMSLLVLGVILGPKRNRLWTYERATRLRNSLRNSFRKTRQIENA